MLEITDGILENKLSEILSRMSGLDVLSVLRVTIAREVYEAILKELNYQALQELEEENKSI